MIYQRRRRQHQQKNQQKNQDVIENYSIQFNTKLTKFTAVFNRRKCKTLQKNNYTSKDKKPKPKKSIVKIQCKIISTLSLLQNV